jgi:hypothetical protein
MRLFTSITAGLVVGWMFSGLLLCFRGGFEDFDSEQLMERKMSYTLLSTLALIFLLINLILGAHRESRRRTSVVGRAQRSVSPAPISGHGA